MKHALVLVFVTLPALAGPPTTAPEDRIPLESYVRLAYRNPGPVSIAGYRAPTISLNAEASSRIKLQNADPYDFYVPCYYGGWGCFYGPYRTPYGLIQSSGSLPW